MDYNILFNLIVSKASKNSFCGIDPYDFASGRFKFPNFILSKFSFLNKISPFNFRRILGIGKSENSKSNALFLQALSLQDYYDYSQEIEYLKNWLINNQSKEFNEYSLGFAFEMSLSRYKSGPGKTSLIISLFGLFSFIELFKKNGDEQLLTYIKSFEQLLDDKWLKFEDEETLWYSYLPDQKDEVYNATAKVGKFYALFYEIFPSEIIKKKLKKILNYLIKVQNSDGSWGYSVKNPYVDNFHTAFVLESIHHIHKIVSSTESLKMFDLGLIDFKKNCFVGDRPLHFHKIHFPKDIRSKLIDTEIRDISNSIILFSKIGDIEFAESILKWSSHNYFDKKNNYFYFFQNRLYKSKIDYVRWQAWMALAISEYLRHKNNL